MKISKGMIYLSLALASVSAGFDAYAVDQSLCQSGSNVLLYDNGALKACQLEKDYAANEIQCKGNNQISFYSNGNLESCVLSRSATLGMNKCKENGLISFYIDGKLKGCMKPAN
jgi:hypothetical protein